MHAPRLFNLMVVPVGLAACLLTSSASAQTPPASAPAPAATDGVAVPSDYVIGAEDVLGVLFWRDQEMSGDVTVRPDGRITLPLIGDISAAGLRPEALKDVIEKAANRFVTDANVTIVVRQINSRKVFITGEVTNPGAYPLIGPRTVMQLIALAGGLSEYADASSLSIMRQEGGNTKYFKFNYKEVSRGRKLEQNIQLKPGDTVVVP